MSQPAITKIKPHHLVDIIIDLGKGVTKYEPHSYGHALHSVAQVILGDPRVQIELAVGVDDICAPCRNNVASACVDTIDTSFRPQAPTSKQEYNRQLDLRWLERLGFKDGARMSAGDFCRRVLRRSRDLHALYPYETPQRTRERRRQLLRGLALYLQHARDAGYQSVSTGGLAGSAAPTA